MPIFEDLIKEIVTKIYSYKLGEFLEFALIGSIGANSQLVIAKLSTCHLINCL
jgi:hypothetical protein